jgi:hypothetical protein
MSGPKIHVFRFRGKWVAAGYYFWRDSSDWRAVMDMAITEATRRKYGKRKK